MQCTEYSEFGLKLTKGMLFSVEQAFVGREEMRAPLKTPAWEAISKREGKKNLKLAFLVFIGRNIS